MPPHRRDWDVIALLVSTCSSLGDGWVGHVATGVPVAGCSGPGMRWSGELEVLLGITRQTR